MFEKLFSWFENRYAPLEQQDDPVIPSGVWNFCRYFIVQFKGALVVAMVAGGLIAVLDVMKPVALGWLIDLLANANRETIFLDYGNTFLLAGGILLVFGPLLILLAFLVEHQVLWPTIFTRIRGQIHWHVLRQSWPFFQNDFAGRTASKGDQTAFALRDGVMNSVDAVWYVLIYLVSAFVVLTSADWRLAVPMALWLVIVSVHVSITMRGLAKSAEAVAEARSVLSGGIIDSYTNVQTVKMFALQDREDEYASKLLMAAHHETRRLNRNITYIWVPL